MAYPGGHARREEIARLLGFRSNRELVAFRKASPENAADVTRRREHLQNEGLLAGPATPKLRAQRVFKEPDSRHVRTNREAELNALFKVAAAHDGRIVSCIVTVSTASGEREMSVWAKGGMDAGEAWRQIEALRAAGVEKPALSFIVDQLQSMGDGKYAPEGVTVDDVKLVNMAAEW